MTPFDVPPEQPDEEDMTAEELAQKRADKRVYLLSPTELTEVPTQSFQSSSSSSKKGNTSTVDAVVEPALGDEGV